MTYIKLTSQNLRCGSCLTSLRSVLDKISVENVNINFLDKTFSFEFDEQTNKRENVLQNIKANGFDNIILEEYIY
ncbi:copper chaperone [Ureaplasma sp. ES3154-GEN]|uniref:heavy-metal-associated domain-containing protein n=1 Tax=Ureaplasma sp. ES3154-GEN TaxID=2984844 RepID=UPI0021E8F3EF|nr:copper chaperone [Ureaplasma sp. ES3154-GEN]MCV3743737.1 copper chaperone [Ureaplasma sp. ES3154-GEN]